MDGNNYFWEIKKHNTPEKNSFASKHNKLQRRNVSQEQLLRITAFFMSCHYTKTFVHLSIIAAVSNFNVFKLIGWYQQTFTCLKSTVETPRKRCGICSKLTIKTVECHSSVFIVNFEQFRSVAIVYYEQISFCRGVLSCVNIITQSIKIRRCFI